MVSPLPEGGRQAGSAGGGVPQESIREEASAGGVVYRRGEDIVFLLIRDPYDNWGLPKGHIEPGETVLEAAIREVGEETGLTELRALDELPSIDWYFRDRAHQLVHKRCRFFLMESASGEARPQLAEGISDCRWLPFEEAVATLTHDNARRVLRAARERLTSILQT